MEYYWAVKRDTLFLAPVIRIGLKKQVKVSP